jgi:two-component system, chemotaxis family, protein-glutamate methylesterase/glutaminase
VIRVFVVDDSGFARRAITRVLRAEPAITVVGEAASGPEALLRVPSAHPDLVTLDLDMPGMNGLTVLRAMLGRDPGLRVLMLSAHTRDGAEATVEALAAGAVDFLDKSRFGLMEFEGLGRELVARVKALGGRSPTGASAGGNGRGAPGETGHAPPIPPSPSHLAADLCVLGASTGGPAAIQQVLEALPADFPLPVAVVQHMPPGFTGPFARRLDQRCRLRVREAVEGDRLERGRVLIAPAGSQMRLNADLGVMLNPETGQARHVPSVDVLMLSAARVRPGRVLGILLTGMGDDGADGMAAIRAQGGVTLAESEATCVVYGMPRAAYERGGVTHLLALPEIVEWLSNVKAASLAESSARR